MLKPSDDRVIVEVAEGKEKTIRGIVLASAARERPRTRTVIAVGEGRLLENGEKVPVVVKTGGQVMLEKYTGTEVKYEGKEYLAAAGKDIMTVVK